MDAVKFLAEYNRMCNTYNDCVGCPIHNKPFCHPHDMTTNDERKELVDAIEKWSKEHPIVTSEMSDTISRQAAIDVTWEEPTYTDTLNVLTEVRDKIRALPSAEPSVPTCDGCRYVGTYDTDFPCSKCIRREKDYYVQER